LLTININNISTTQLIFWEKLLDSTNYNEWGMVIVQKKLHWTIIVQKKKNYTTAAAAAAATAAETREK